MISLYRLYLAHVEWLGLRPTLEGQEHRYFVRWLCRAYPEVASGSTAELTYLRQQCREIQRGGKSPPRSGLTMATLKRHAPALTARYLAEAAPRPSFAEFLEHVLRSCPTEDALKRFLGSTSTDRSS